MAKSTYREEAPNYLEERGASALDGSLEQGQSFEQTEPDARATATWSKDLLVGCSTELETRAGLPEGALHLLARAPTPLHRRSSRLSSCRPRTSPRRRPSRS